MGEASLALDPEADLDAHERKALVRLVVVGSVDDGKSTLIGRLLYETHGLYEDQIAQVRRASRQTGGEIDYSLFTDGLRAEREQGITIDVAYRYFATETRKFIVADTPGHAQYTRNMATGASTAEVGVILIDARLGVLPQSRRHAYIASLLGIPHLLVAVNKMDLVQFDQRRFEEIAADFGTFASQLGFAGVTFLPVSAREGDNVVTRSERMPWHRGGTLLSFLEGVPLTLAGDPGPLRLPIQIVLRPHSGYRGFAGQLTSGRVRPGDEVVILPSGRRTHVLAVDSFEGELREARAPMSVALRLTEEVDVSRGDLLASVAGAPAVSAQLEAMLVWFSEQPLDPQRAYLMKQTTRWVPIEALSVGWRLDLETLEHVPAQRLSANDIGRVSLRLKRPVVIDAYARLRGTGAFIVVDALSNATVAAGTVLEASPEIAPAVLRGRVTTAERRQRLGQVAGIVAIRGERAASEKLGAALERLLFDAGVVATVVETREAALACATAGLVSLLLAAAGEPTLASQQLVIELGAEAQAEQALAQLLSALGR